MEILPVKIRNELRDFRVSQEKLFLHYQSEQNHEMAYLVRWSILEKIVKTVATEYRRSLLIESLQEWLAHVKKNEPKPKKNPNTAVEFKTLPQKNEFIASLNYYGLNGQDMWLVMDSTGKHRQHRNKLAHTGKKFINYLLYTKLLTDMEKLTNKVFAKIESNKSLNRTRNKKRALYAKR